MCVRSLIRTYVHPSRNVWSCTANKQPDLEAPISIAYAHWQGTICQFFHPKPQRSWPSISRSKIRIEYIGKFIREISMIALQSLSETLHSLYRYDGWYHSPQCQGMSGVTEEYIFCQICQGVLAHSLIFKRNAEHCILPLEGHRFKYRQFA